MADLIEILESFNRKERFFLLAEALGQQIDTDRAAFKLSVKFRKKLSSQLELQIPGDAYVAMDYHIDWLQGSLVLAHPDQYAGSPIYNPDRVVKGTQEDIDLLIAFRDSEDIFNLILVEAKGYSSWNNKQMKSKIGRLKKMFGSSGEKYGDVKPRFLLISKSQPKNLKTDWPTWAFDKDNQLNRLDLSLHSGRRKVQRCDKNCRSDAKGNYYHILSA